MVTNETLRHHLSFKYKTTENNMCECGHSISDAAFYSAMILSFFGSLLIFKMIWSHHKVKVHRDMMITLYMIHKDKNKESNREDNNLTNL